MEKEEAIFQRRLEELSDQAYQKNIVTFTDFINLNELNIFYRARQKGLLMQSQLSGGYLFAERQMVAFLPDALYYEWDYPIDVVKIEPNHKKYAGVLTHRDYLGAILNLGMERCKIGDILVTEDGTYVFCHQHMSILLVEELHKIRHTYVTAEVIPSQDFHYQPKFEECTGTVASVRLDSILSLTFGLSRSRLTEYIQGGKVFINGRLSTSNSYELKAEDIVSVRGLGKFRFEGTGKTSRKGRIYVTVQKYA